MTAQTNVSQEIATQGIAYSRLLWVAPAAMLVSTIANLGFYAAAGGLFPEVADWPGASAGQIIGANIVYLLIGAVVFAVVARASSRPMRNYIVVATVGLLASLFMPISAGMGFGPPEMAVPGAATVITLCLMHVLSYVISVPMFIRLAMD